MAFYVYMMRCADGSLYTGYTTDVKRRERMHNTGKGAKYTRSRRPVTLAWYEPCEDKPTALRREAALKKLTHADKLALIENAEQEETKMQKITVGIEGMACEMCEAHVNETVRKHFDVKKVTASHRKAEAVILTEADISEEQLKAAIDPTGYTVTSVTKEPYEKKKGLFSFLQR